MKCAEGVEIEFDSPCPQCGAEERDFCLGGLTPKQKLEEIISTYRQLSYDPADDDYALGMRIAWQQMVDHIEEDVLPSFEEYEDEHS